MKYILFGIVGLTTVTAWSDVSSVWNTFVSDAKAGRASVLPDYSYAGYKYGTEAIPDVQWKVFDVTDFGALPDDGLSDYDGIQQAIRAAEANGSGIVFFPAGKFLVGEEEDIAKSIEITGANIVLRGSGSGADGTEIHQKNHYLAEDPEKMWTGRPIFVFRHPASQVFLSRNLDQARRLAQVTGAATRESFTITVDNAAGVEPGQAVMLCARSTGLNEQFLKGLQPRDIYSEIVTNGVSVSEKHIVAAVEGSEITFMEPIRADVDPQIGWTLYDYPMVEGWGVEDIHFSGNCPVPFVHHKDYIHDSGFIAVRMEQGRDCWIRRCRFTSMSHAFFASGCLSSSFLMNTVDGHQGHGNFTMNWGGGNLVGLCQDLTDKGSFHGCGMSHQNVGGVVWRYESVGETKQTPRYGGPDFHAQFPYCSLWDASTANLINNGGSYKLLPNHLRDLTFWNLEQIGEKTERDFWKLPQSAEEKKEKFFGGTKLVYPNYIGFHGVESKLHEAHLGLFESYGQPVEPESLYEAQLELRLGSPPAWIESARKGWQTGNPHAPRRRPVKAGRWEFVLCESRTFQ